MPPHSVLAGLHGSSWLSRSIDIDTSSQADSNSSTMPTPTAGREEKYVRHCYKDRSRDYTNEMSLSLELVYSQVAGSARVSTAFPVKLHHMLCCVDADGHSDVVSWAPHGRAFVLKKPQKFADIVLCKYFKKQTKLPSFQRQLNLYGFKRLTKGADAGGYYHELLLRTRPLLAHKIRRFKIKGTMVRHRSNPDQEPDFYSMTPLRDFCSMTPLKENKTPCVAKCSCKRPSLQKSKSPTHNTLSLPHGVASQSNFPSDSLSSLFSRNVTQEYRKHQGQFLAAVNDTTAMTVFGKKFHSVPANAFIERYKQNGCGYVVCAIRDVNETRSLKASDWNRPRLSTCDDTDRMHQKV